MEQNKPRRTATNSAGERLMDLEVLNLSGECVTFTVSDSMLGRDLWQMILEKFPPKPGIQLRVCHNTPLVLNQSLRQQGVEGEGAQGLFRVC